LQTRLEKATQLLIDEALRDDPALGTIVTAETAQGRTKLAGE
jgi:hypothetical protein